MGSLASGRNPGFGYRDGEELEHFKRRIATVLDNVLQGKLICAGSFTLTANVASTTISDQRMGIYSIVHWEPTTANAAAAMTNVSMGTKTGGSFVLRHANNAQTDRTFNYTVIG